MFVVDGQETVDHIQVWLDRIEICCVNASNQDESQFLAYQKIVVTQSWNESTDQFVILLRHHLVKELDVHNFAVIDWESTWVGGAQLHQQIVGSLQQRRKIRIYVFIANGVLLISIDA